MKTRSLLLALLAVLGPLAACGDDDPGVATDGSSDTTAATTEAVRIPQAIVSLSPTATESLFAIGAGDQVVAVDDQSDFPADAPTTDLSAYEPNVEAIAAYEPDLVISSSDDAALVDGLEALDIEVLVQEAAVELDDVYAQIEELGDVTGHRPEALSITSQMRADLIDIKMASVERPQLTAYWELDPTYYSVTSATFIGSLLELVNVKSIADEAQAEANDYPQLSAEFIVQADPDLILLADSECCQQDAASVAARDGWAGMKAVAEGHIVELGDDVASRWGPRIVDLLRAIDDAANKAVL